MTDLGGTLFRIAPDRWRWSDGVEDPRIYDLSPDRWHCFGQRRENGELEVAIPLVVAVTAAELAWVLEGSRGGKFPLETASRTEAIHLHRLLAANLAGELAKTSLDSDSVIRVPFADWRRWCRENPRGAAWDARYGEEILSRARLLGFRDDAELLVRRVDAGHPLEESRRESIRLPPGFVPKETVAP